MKQAVTPKTFAALGVSLLAAALAATIYHAFVSTQFPPVRIGVVDTEQTASRRIVTVPLPDVSALHGQTAVLAFRLRNGGPETKRIGLLRDGLPAHRVVLPPNRDISWDIVVPPERVEALTAPAGGEPQTLELTGDADAWAVMAFEVRNYRPWWLLPPFAFFLLSAALAAPPLLYLFHAPKALALRARAIGAGVKRGWTSHELTFERGAALLGLAAVAIAQPIFEVVSNSPEFFPARSTPPATAVVTVLAICLGIPLMLLGIERAIRAVNRRAAAAFYGVVIALLCAALVMPWFRRSAVLVFPWDALISVFIGLAAALSCSHIRLVRQFLTALAPAALVVPALFFLDPSVTQSFSPSESAAAVRTIERTPPIVLVVFDELPMNLVRIARLLTFWYCPRPFSGIGSRVLLIRAVKMEILAHRLQVSRPSQRVNTALREIEEWPQHPWYRKRFRLHSCACSYRRPPWRKVWERSAARCRIR